MPGLSISPVPHPTLATQVCPPPDPRYSNLDLQTQEAYEMAVKGLIRPMNKSPMLITGIRCLHFAPPEFLLGKLPQEVGAGRWDSTECPCRAGTCQSRTLLAKAARTACLPSPGLDLADHRHTQQMLSCLLPSHPLRPELNKQLFGLAAHFQSHPLLQADVGHQTAFSLPLSHPT